MFISVHLPGTLWVSAVLFMVVSTMGDRKGESLTTMRKGRGMAWIYLLIAGMLEMGWAIGLKYTEGWTRLWPSIATGLTMIASFYFLSLALRTLPVGTAYAVWTGIGAAGTALLGMFLLGEARDLIKIVCIMLIISGVAGLRFASGGH